MSANLIIIQLLHAPSNHTEFLRACWENLSHEQKREVFYFLYHGEQYKTFLTMLRTEMNTENPLIPWTHLYGILAKIKKLDADVVNAFKDIAPLSEHNVFRIQHKDMKDLWTQRKKDFIVEYKARKAALLKSLDFARNQGLAEDRQKILADLKQLFPNDTDVDRAFHAEKEFRARQTLNKISAKRNLTQQFSSRPSNDDKEFVAQLLHDGLRSVKKNKKLALDFVILFFQMELYPEALAVLDGVKKKSAALLWHELYICIEAKQYARVLSVIELLKRKKKITSDQSFSLLYFQALAMHGLGQVREAQQIIKSIVKIRPHFKSATSLLLEWENDK